MTKQEFIFGMIGAALWEKPMAHFDMTPWEYKQVMIEAEKQCTTGMIIDCLRSNNMGLQKKCVVHMLKLQNTLELENKRLDANVAKLAQTLKAHDVDFVVVKGQTIGKLYPKPRLRTPGDIDFYVPKKDFERAADILTKEWGVTPDDGNDKIHMNFKYGGNEFEMHSILRYFNRRKDQRAFDDLVDGCERVMVDVDGTEVPTLEPTVNVFYTFLHMYNHFIKMGVALRQINDVAMLLHRHKERIDWERLEKILRNFGYMKAFRVFGGIMVYKLGMPAEDFAFKIKDNDRRYADKVMELIWRHGNWGKYERDMGSGKGWKYSWEKMKLRLSTQFTFFRLSPKENLLLVFYELPRKGLKAVKRL